MVTYRYEEKIVEIKNGFFDADFISQRNKDLVNEFLNEYGTLHLSKASSYNKYYHLFKRVFREFLTKDLDKLTKKDMFALIDKIKSSDISERGKEDSFKILKTFYFSWYEEGHKINDDLKEMMTFFRKFTYKPNQNKIEEPDILVEQEVEKLIDACMNERDRALIMVLWETGARIGEIMSMRLKNVTEWEHGFKLQISESKTDKRTLPVIKCAPYLTQYLENHPKKGDKNSKLWMSFESGEMKYDSARMMLNKVAKRAKLDKKVYPHLFRHSRATDCANKGWNEFRMRKWFGWSMSSDTPSIYVRRSGINLENEIAKENGVPITEEEKKQDLLKPKKCLVCKHLNAATSKYCSNCYRPINLEAFEEKEKSQVETIKIMQKQLDILMKKVS